MFQFAAFFWQGQVLTPSAIESISKSGSSLLVQLPILIVAVLGLVLAVRHLKSNRVVSLLTIIASILLLLSSFAAPLVSVWLPFFYTPQAQTMPDGTIVQPSLEILQNNLFYANFISSGVISVALLIYLAAIFIGRGKPAGKSLQK